MKFSTKDIELHERINKIFPNDAEKCAMIATLAGAAMVQTMYLEVLVLKASLQLPETLLYAMALTVSNVQAILSGETDKEEFEKLNFPALENLNEQEETEIYRKLNIVIKSLYHNLMEREKNKDKI